MLVKDFINEFRLMVGDTTFDAPDDFLIAGLNWALRELPTNPKLDKLFSHHYTVNLDANSHYRWDITKASAQGGDQFFAHITDLEYLHFWESTGGQPKELRVCNVEPNELYANGLPQLMPAGKPRKYAFEREQDNLFLVLDRPSNIPIIIDFIAYGLPRQVTSVNDDVPISTLCKNAILALLRSKFYEEADDMAFSGSVFDTLDSKWIPQLVEEIYKRMGCQANYIVGN